MRIFLQNFYCEIFDGIQALAWHKHKLKFVLLLSQNDLQQEKFSGNVISIGKKPKQIGNTRRNPFCYLLFAITQGSSFLVTQTILFHFYLCNNAFFPARVGSRYKS